MRGRGRVGGTPELRIVVGVDDNLTPSLLPLVWWRTEGGKGTDSPGSSLAFRKGGIPAAVSPLSATPAASPSRLPIPVL